MTQQWLIVGISGVTCGGKTTLATQLNNIVSNSIMLSQDDYFLEVDDPRHTWIPELKHINFDNVSSLDMEKMYHDILSLIKDPQSNVTSTPKQTCNCFNDINLQKKVNDKFQNGLKLLIIEGFCIFNYQPLASLCQLKYYFTLPQEECYARRIKRTYEPPDCPGYFEKCVWPEYLKLIQEVRDKVKDVKYFDGTTATPIEEVLQDIVISLQ